ADLEELFFVYPVSLSDEQGSSTPVNNDDDLFKLLSACGGFDTEHISFNFISSSFEIACYQFQYPVSILTTNGDNNAIPNSETLADLMLAGQVADFIYPYQLANSIGDIFAVDTPETLEELISECSDTTTDILFDLYLEATEEDGVITGCYTINFPITVTSYSNGIATVRDINDTNELLDFTLSFFDDYSINYPISVVLTSSEETITLYTDEETQAMIAECGN
ncbi:MAG: hypothetical protein AAF738_04525, partial [Bacteroidota bacterium]